MASLWLGIRQLEIDRYFNPGFNGFTAGVRWDKTPLLDRFACGSVEQVMTGAGVDLDGLGSTFFVNEHAQKHPAFFAFTPSTAGILGPRGFMIAGFCESRSSLSRSSTIAVAGAAAGANNS
jgi:hypothetical protein